MRTIIILLASSFLFQACNKDGEVPTFVHIPDFEFVTTPDQGFDTENITEIWVFSGGKMLGAYDLPADVPILGDGPNEVFFGPGIKNNGQSSTRIQYPFYQPYTEVINLGAGNRDTIVPVFTYNENVNFEVDDFENSTFYDGLEVVANEHVVYGLQCGFGEIAQDELVFRAELEDAVTLPNGDAVFLELDYKCNNSFAVGVKSTVLGNTSDSFALIINPTGSSIETAEWRKIYVELSFAMQQISGAEDFKVYFEAFLDNGNSAAEFYFDNAKILYY